MKRAATLLLAIATSAFAAPQTVNHHATNYAVRYEKAHVLLEKDAGLNVVDYDIEWPEIIDFQKATSLKRFISKTLYNVATASLDTLLSTIGTTYGAPITKQFDTIPDDRRFCYVTSKAHIASYKPGHWIAYYLDDRVEPQALSAFHARQKCRVVLYDISNDRTLLADELLNSKVASQEMPQSFYDQLFSPLPDDFFNTMRACEINGVWAEGGKLCFLVSASTATQQTSYTVSMPLAQNAYALNRNGRSLFTREAKKAVQPHPATLPAIWHGDTIYNKVEKMPQFKGGTEGLREYMSHAVRPDIKLDKPARVLVSFIVDKVGAVQDISVVTPVNPVIDRHAASIIKGMPAFAPGEQDGQKICVRMYMPVSYKP